jgi:uncharacterized membrane protein YfcA
METFTIFMIVALVSIIKPPGITIGSMLGRKIEGEQLKKVFGWFVLLMGIYIITHELTKESIQRDQSH